MRIEDVKIGMKVIIKGISQEGWCKDARKCIGKTFTIDSRGYDGSNEFGFKEVQWYFNCADFEPVLAQSEFVHKFHVGQPVRCNNTINPDSRLVIGTVYTVGTVNNCSLTIKEWCDSSYTASQFEPAYSLEVGCKVRVVDGTSSYNSLVGTVSKMVGSICVHVIDNDDTTYQFEKKYLIVLEPAPKKVKPKGLVYTHMFAENPIYGIDWGSSMFSQTDIDKCIGGNIMENNEKKYKELAERMQDEYVGFDTTKTLARQNGTVFLKKAGECTIERRDVTMTLTVDDIETLLKQKGITKALGVHEIEAYSGTYTVGIINFVPIKKDKFTEANEAV